MKAFFLDLWARWQTLRAPLPVQAVAAAVPLAPMAQDQFANTHAQAAQDEQQERWWIERTISDNNAFLFRDYGQGPIVLVDGRLPEVKSQFVSSALVPRCDP